MIGEIADAQRGRVGRDQLLAAGVDRNAITRRLANGRLELVHRCVYAVPHTGDLSLAAEAAALLTCPLGAMLSHHSAATLWELRPGRARPVHVTMPSTRGWRNSVGVKVHRSVTLTPTDIRLHQGLPVTSPARTLLDVAATLPDRDIERLLDEALFTKRLATRAELLDIVNRAGSHPGGARLARVLHAHASPTKTGSPPAERLLTLLRAAGLPEPQVEVPMLDYRLDFYWPELRLVVEVDAYGTHGSPARFEADRRRDARLLTEMGIVVIRVTKVMIEERPLEALGMVARAIGQREGELRARYDGARSRSR